jgi:hypothetical protein
MAIERILLRRDTTANWESVNPILALGEPGYDRTLGKLKIGNGVSVWTALPFLVGDGGGGGTSGVSSVAGRAGAVTLVAADISDSGTVGRAALQGATQAAVRSAIGAQVAGNYASSAGLTATNDLAVAAQQNLDAFKATKAAPNGLASLDGLGKVPSAQLPAFVDDVIEVGTFASLPPTGVTGVIYVTIDTNLQYRWSGSAYIALVSSPGSTDAVPEGTTNFYFTNARAQAALTTQLAAKAPVASPTFTGTVSGVTKAHVGLGNVDNTSDANKPISTAQQSALDAKAPIASPTFTGTVGGITKTHVGLANVDNTSDANKPVSTAQAAAIAAKYTKPVGGITSADMSAPVVGALNNANTAVQETEAITYVRRYTSGAWPVRGDVPSSSIVMWIGPTPPPINATYALAGVDLYSATVS